MMSMVAFLDACVLYPSNHRDVILTMAEAGLFQIRWSPDVLEEMERNLMKAGKAGLNLRDVMESAFPDAMVSQNEYLQLIDDMPNHRKDRHVLAAAIATNADVLVTANRTSNLCQVTVKSRYSIPVTFCVQCWMDSLAKFLIH